MKKIGLLIITAILGLCMAGSCLAAGRNTDTLADWGIKVEVPDNSVAILDGEDGCYYIYPEESGSIPYVMLYVYDEYVGDEEDFATGFLTDLLSEHYDDLEVVGTQAVDIADKEGYEIDYNYTVQGYEVLDRRVVIEENDRMYVFTSKEVEELDMSVGTLLEDTIENCEFVDADDIDIDIDIDDPDELEEVTWEDIVGELDEEDLDGEFVAFPEAGLQLYIPGNYEAVELDDEMVDMFYLAYYTTDPENWDPAIAVQYVDTLGFEDFDEYVEVVDSMEGYAEIMGDVLINGIHCLMYQIPEIDAIVVGTVIDDAAFEVTMTPFSDDDLSDTLELVAASIMDIDEDADSDYDDGEINGDDGDDIVISYDPTENNLADLLQGVLDSLNDNAN